MTRKLTIFRSLKEQEDHFLSYFHGLSPKERLDALARLQLKNYPDFGKPGVKKITIRKPISDNGN